MEATDFRSSRRAALARVLALAWAPGVALGAGAGNAAGLKFPQRPLRIVSPIAVGTGLDDFTRMLAQWLGQRLEQPCVVENRQGANTAIAAEHVARSDPDGHTLLIASATTLILNPLLQRQQTYRPEQLAPVARLLAIDSVLVVPAAGPHASLSELVGEARRRPGEISIAYTSAGYRAFVAALEKSAGIRFNAVPYKAAPAAITDMLAGRLNAMVLEVSSVGALVQSGQLRALGIVGPQRTPMLPQVPTVAELGQSPIPVQGWIGLFAPARVAPEVASLLSDLVLGFLRSPEASRFVEQRGNSLAALDGPAFARAIAAERPVWQNLIEQARIEPE